MVDYSGRKYAAQQDRYESNGTSRVPNIEYLYQLWGITERKITLKESTEGVVERESTE